MSTGRSYTLFDTAIGPCGIVWGERGVAGLQLPEGRKSATRARLLERFAGASEAAPPRPVRRTIEDVVGLLRGNARDLTTVTLDMDGVPPFHRRVYEVARTIAPGATLSYGEVAARLGAPNSARAVGQALGRNPFAVIVPCHRVLAAGGKAGGFSANGGVDTKLRMLAIERGQSDSDRAVTRRSDTRTPTRTLDGLQFDPRAAVMHLRSRDPGLARVIDAVGPFRMELQKTPSVFGALAEAIVYQQLTGKAAATIYSRVCALFPRASKGPSVKQILSVSDAKLRGAGLSRAKALALRDLARKTAAGELPTLAQARRMTDDEIIERLTKVRGVGRWTVEMLLMFRLGRPDVLPADDYGVRKGFALAFKKRELPSRKDLEKRAAKWTPYRTVASWYLWRVLAVAAR